ncbi:MAG TPA: hypothetical protein ENN77_02710 [Candidatus Wirthbacteria bacterium]|nr:hypothetical protein [Candidatus Wirthbacteria bacterium]
MAYTKHFKLKEQPFSSNPDPRFFYLTDQHKTAIDKSMFVADQKLGLGLTYGSPGTGKTSMSRILYQKFADSQDFKTVMLADPGYKTDNRMLRAIIHEFDVGKTQKAMDDSLLIFQKFLEKTVYKEGKTCLLIVDHGERMKEELYALLSDLLELRKDDERLLQVLVFGRHDVRDKLADPRSKNLDIKVASSSSLEPMSFNDMVSQISFRFSVAGLSDQPFTDEALKELFIKSKGVPRAVNRLADKALYEALMADKTVIDRDIIHRAEQVLGLTPLNIVLQDNETLPKKKTGKRGRPPVKPKRA